MMQHPLNPGSASGQAVPLSVMNTGSGLSTTPNNHVDIGGLLSILWRRRLAIGFTAFATLALAVVYLLAATPLYTSSTKILIDPRKKSVVKTSVVPSGFDGTIAMVESQVKIIGSDKVLRKVVKAEGLARDPEFAPLPGIKKEIRERIWGQPVEVTEEYFTIKALETLGELLKIKRSQKTYVIDVEVTSSDRFKAQRLAHAVAAAYLEDQAEAKSEATKNANVLLDARLEKLRERLREAEIKVEEFRKSKKLLAVDGELVNKKQLAHLNEQLTRISVRTAETKATYQKIQSLLKSGLEPDAISQAVKSPLITRLRLRHAEATRQVANLAATLGARHPRLVSAQAQVVKINVLIRSELARIAKSSQLEYEVAKSREQTLRSNLAALTSTANVTDEARVRLRELEREATARRAVYQSLLVRAKETSEQENLFVADARIISPAFAPLKPSKPKKILLLAMALVGGLGLGMVLALLAEHLKTGIDSGSDLRAATGLDPIGLIPPLQGAKQSIWSRLGLSKSVTRLGGEPFGQLMAQSNHSRSPFNAAMAHLVRRIAGRRSNDGPRAVLLTSSFDGEGKSIAAWGMAITAAVSGKRVLLIDADTANPALSRIFAKGARLTVDDVVHGRARLGQLVHESHMSLRFLPMAPPLGKTIPAAAMPQLKQALSALMDEYDLVIIDAGSLAEDPYTLNLADAADDILLVVRAGSTGRETISTALRDLSRPGRAMPEVVLSMVTRA